MARRAVIAPGVLKGYLLEEIVAYLIKNAGYRLITDPQTDPHDLALLGNGLQVRGRGGFHQADVLGELSWAPAFGNPIRLFIEAKWRRNGSGRVGIPEVRHAVGILQDVNQALVTVRANPVVAGQGLDGDDVLGDGRSFCYTYRYALCSAVGFTSGAQAYALAHQVALLDLSHEDYHELRTAVEVVGDEMQSYIRWVDSRRREFSAGARKSLLKTIRATLRQALWQQGSDDLDPNLRRILNPLIVATRSIGELFVGVSATGFVILLKADHPDRMIRHMRATTDPETTIHYRQREDASFQWQISVGHDEDKICRLSFVLPDAMLRALDEKHAGSRRLEALNIKEQHFSRITVYRMTDEKSMICSLKIDGQWLAQARAELDQRQINGR